MTLTRSPSREQRNGRGFVNCRTWDRNQATPTTGEQMKEAYFI